MTSKDRRKALARHIQNELGIPYSTALAACDSENPPPGWIVLRSEQEVAVERLRRATADAAARPDDPAAQILAAFAALRLLEPHAWAPRCGKRVAGIDPHFGDWTEARCTRPFHLGPCAPDDVLHFLWEQDMGPASQSFDALVAHLRMAWRALDMPTDLDRRARDLVRTVPSYFEEDEVWANIDTRARSDS